MASIALTAVVLPSRGQRVVCLLFALVALLATIAVLACSESFHTPYLIATACGLACALPLRAAAGSAKAHQIDISGLGQIRLTVQLCSGRIPAARPGTPVCPAARDVRLLPASTLWPSLLLLLLRDSSGVLTPVVVLPDSLSPAAFRALACACRAIRHQAQAAEK